MSKPTVKIVTEKTVNRCQICPRMISSMDGPYCAETGKAVYPAGRNGIHPSCPFKIRGGAS